VFFRRMISFFAELRLRNPELFVFGLFMLFLSLLFLALSKWWPLEVNGANAWFKPFKFAASTMFYAWTLAWFIHYLPDFNKSAFNWSVIILLGFEVVYIAIQAGRGMSSHFNVSSPFYSAMFSLMAFAATAVTIYTLWVAVRFFQWNGGDLPDYYLWSIRLALLLFVVFSFEGFAMGARMAHTVGGPDGSAGLPVLGWSKTLGDLRIAHFVGMHALQVLPLVSFYLLKNTRLTVLFALAYAALAVWVLVRALNGRGVGLLGSD